MKVGDLVRQRKVAGLRGQDRGIGIVHQIRKKDHARWKGDPWDSVKVYWGENHRMNERWTVRGALEVIDDA